MGVEEAPVREAATHVLGRTERIALHDLIPTTRVKKIIELSFSEAMRMQSPTVSSGHLLAGLAVEGGSIAAQVLNDLGATPERVIRAVEVELGLAPEPEPSPGIGAERFRDVMSAFPSGVVIVTAFGVDGTPRGLTVNAFSAVSLDPALVLVCIDKSSNTLPAVQHTRGFTVNILAAGREALARRMATKVSDKFDGLEWRRSDTDAGGPILPADAAAYAVCTLHETIDGGDHWILIGTVVDGAHNHGVRPMLYHRRAYLDF
jgi:flavin reductase (DIM6/NTAB) family NADH-FMN oxidoreductase RutF